MTGLFSHDIFSTKVIVDRFLCTSPSFVRWAKTHRKKRIRNKFKKKYGAVFSTCKGVAYHVGNAILACPCLYKKIKKEMVRP